MHSPLHTLLVLAILAGALTLIVRRMEVRLVLALTGLALFSAAGEVPGFFQAVFKEMANAKTIIPICSAMGFAYVLKLTGCDHHLVHLLVGPLRRVKWLVVPGGIVAAFLVNAAIQSQTGTAAVVGPVLVPLLLAAGVGPVTAGAVLLLGSSMGGELCNPGAVEITTLAGIVDRPAPEVVRRVAPLNLLACGTALLGAWVLAFRWERSGPVPLQVQPAANEDLTEGAAAATGTVLGPSPSPPPDAPSEGNAAGRGPGKWPGKWRRTSG